MKPVILISGVPIEPGSFTVWKGWDHYDMSESYTSSVVKAGGVPLMAPLGDEELAREQISVCDGLLIPGGADVDPSLYNEEKSPLCGGTNLKLDFYQIALIEAARAKKIPIFGICRGIQIINVALGGSLFQDSSLRSEAALCHRHLEDGTKPCHEVELVPGGFLSTIFKAKTLGVNSLHHQEVDRLGQDLKASAYATDGAVEALESISEPIFAVQWHPEAMMMEDQSMLPLWTYFIEACKAGKKQAD